MARKSGVEVIWHGESVRRQLDALVLEQIDKHALEIIVEADPPIDTGFLSASGYVNSSSGLNTFDEGWPDGKYFSRHSQSVQQRSRVEQPEPPPKNGAVAGFAADYSLYVEEEKSFLYEAAQRVARRNR